MRQKLIIIKSKDLDNYNIPQLYFDENVIIIVYDKFTSNLFRYVHTPRIFLLPDWMYECHKNDQYRITDNTITYNNDTVINNIDVTYKGETYFPKEFVDFSFEQDYKEQIKKYFPANAKTLAEAIDYLSSVNVSVNSFDNLDARLDRLSDFGNPELAAKLKIYFEKHKDAFLDAASLSIQFYDLDDLEFEPLNIKKLALYIKLNNRAYVYKWDGYSTYIDTLTRIMFYTKVTDNIKLFTEHFNKHKPVVVVYGILNYHIAQNIHEKTNINDNIYNMLLKELT